MNTVPPNVGDPVVYDPLTQWLQRRATGALVPADIMRELLARLDMQKDLVIDAQPSFYQVQFDDDKNTELWYHISEFSAKKCLANPANGIRIRECFLKPQARVVNTDDEAVAAISHAIDKLNGTSNDPKDLAVLDVLRKLIQ